MRIAWDGTPIFRQQDGVGRYTKELLQEFSRIAPQHEHNVVGFMDDRWRHQLVSADDHVRYRLLPFPRKLMSLLYKATGGPAVNRALRVLPDAMVYPNFVRFPRVDGVPSVLMVHDVVHLDIPEVVADKNRRFLERWLPVSMQQADLILVLSEFVAHSLERHFPSLKTPVKVLYPGVDESFRHAGPTQAQAVRERLHLPHEYVLYLGSLQPRKNLAGLLPAYARLAPELQQRYPLVLGGAWGWKTDAIKQQLKQLADSGVAVKVLGHVAESDLPGLYAGASLFVFPSLYEGFGLPPLEALATGTAVIASDATSIPEAVGDAGLLLNPHDTAGWTEAMTELLSDEAKRQVWASRGQRRAGQFTWGKSAQTLLGLIHELEQPRG